MEYLTVNLGALVGHVVECHAVETHWLRQFTRDCDRVVRMSKRGMRRRERRLKRARDNRRAAWAIREMHRNPDIMRGAYSHAEVRRWIGGV